MEPQQRKTAPILVGLGNALLDISVHVEKCFLDKYGLAKDGHVLVGKDNEQMLKPLFEEILGMDGVKMSPGGSILNTIRVFQWMMSMNRSGNQANNSATVFFGAAGDDAARTILEKESRELGVDMRLQTVAGQPTGRCASLICGDKRSFCAQLGAASYFDADQLNLRSNQSVIRAAEIFYSGAFFLSVSPEALQPLARHAQQNNKLFCFNLNAAYIPSKYKTELNAILPYVDILFGNDQEARAYAVANNFAEQMCLKSIAKEMANMEKLNKSRHRIVLITQGQDPIIVAEEGAKKCLEFEVPRIAVDKIVDTNGAGDAFAGGFMASLVCGFSLELCVESGCFAATNVIQKRGCIFGLEI